MFHYAGQYYGAPRHVLHYIVILYIAVHCAVLYYALLHYAALHYAALRNVAAPLGHRRLGRLLPPLAFFRVFLGVSLPSVIRLRSQARLIPSGGVAAIIASFCVDLLQFSRSSLFGFSPRRLCFSFSATTFRAIFSSHFCRFLWR